MHPVFVQYKRCHIRVSVRCQNILGLGIVPHWLIWVRKRCYPRDSVQCRIFLGFSIVQ